MEGQYQPAANKAANQTNSDQYDYESEPRIFREVVKSIGVRAVHEGFMLMEESISPYEEMREVLQSKIIDQPAAIEAIIEALESSEARLPNDTRPIATLAFLGPTGVGKSETAKVLADLISSDEGNLIKIDCSDYSHGHEVAKLTGAPPGYVGRDQIPILSKWSVEREGTVILFDEIEKGCDELYNLMLQITGDGILNLNDGMTSKFKNTVIIITSNLGAKEMDRQLSESSLGFNFGEKSINKANLEKTATSEFVKFFRPEFINRINKMAVFHSLSDEGLSKVLDTKLDTANESYNDNYGVHVTLSDDTKRHIVGIAAQDRHMGARPLIRAYEEHVQTVLGRYKGSGQFTEGTHVKVFHRDELPLTMSTGDTPLVFTSRYDHTLRKKSEPLAIEPPKEDHEDNPLADPNSN